MLITLRHLIYDCGSMNRLSRTINRTVSINHGPLTIVISLVVIIAVAEVHLRQGLVAVGIGKHLQSAVFTILKIAFTLAISPEVVGDIFLPGGIFLDAHMSLGHWLTCGSIDHNITYPKIWLFLGHHKQISDVKHPANDLSARLRGEFEHIHANRQALQCYTVFKDLIVGLAGKRHLNAGLRHEFQQGFQFLKVFL